MQHNKKLLETCLSDSLIARWASAAKAAVSEGRTAKCTWTVGATATNLLQNINIVLAIILQNYHLDYNLFCSFIPGRKQARVRQTGSHPDKRNGNFLACSGSLRCHRASAVDIHCHRCTGCSTGAGCIHPDKRSGNCP